MRSDVRGRPFGPLPLLSILLLAAGCGPAENGAIDGLPAPGQPVVTISDWTAGTVNRPRPGIAPPTLVDVRTARHEGFDRVVFRFDGARTPGVHVEYIDQPVRQCGSGNPVQIAGDAWLEIRLEPSNAHTQQGQPTVTDRERMPGLPNLKELELTCDFEAQVAWVLGLASPNEYRVLELENPARLVVDVQH